MRTSRALGVAVLVALTAVPLVTRLAGSVTPQVGGLIQRSVISDETAFTTDVTPDGRLALMVEFGARTNENPSRLMVRDLVTQRTVTVVEGGAGAPIGRPAAVFSADAKRVAHTWWREPRLLGAPVPQALLRVTDTAPGAAPRWMSSGGGVVPWAWSPDGKAIMCLIHGPGANIADPTSIAWVSVADATRRTIKTLEPWRNGASLARPRLSPDGVWIAYAAVAREGSTDTHVYVMDANGQNERVVASIPGLNTWPIWAPDGAHLIFVNSQSGRRDLFAVPVQAGGPSGEPMRLQTGFAGEPIRLARSGDLFFQQTENVYPHHVIAERRSTGTRIERTFSGAGGTWFKGDRFAFVRPGPQGNDLIVRSLETGQERAYKHPGISLEPPRGLSDGSGVIVYVQPAGDGGRPGGAFYRVDVNTGDFGRLFAKDTAEYVRSTTMVLSPDGKILYLAARPNSQTLWTRIVGVNLETGLDASVVTLPGSGLPEAPGLAISPDGTTLAIHASDGRIMTVRVDGREFRELYRPVQGAGWPEIMRWTPDGQSIVFATGGGLPGGGTGLAPWRLMRISAAGGQPEFDGLDSSKLESSVPVPRMMVGSVLSIDLSPDGSRIAFSSRAILTYDVQVIGNVMSALGSAR